MPTANCPTDPIEVMLAHNAWANTRLVDACAGLRDAQLDEDFEMGLGSIRPTVTHIFGAMRGWADFLAKRPARDRLESEPGIGVAQWRAMMPEIDLDFRQAASCGPLDEVITTRRGDREYAFVRSHVIMHVTTHGVHHRAQCINMLRRLGVESLPQSSGMEWGMGVLA